MFSRKLEHLHTSEKLEDDKLCGAVRELALYNTRRGRKAGKHSFDVQGARRELSAAYRQMLLQSRSGIVLPATVHTLMENHYVVDKAQASLYDVTKKLTRGRFTVLENGRQKGVVRIYALALLLLENRNFSIDYAILRKCLSAFQEISPLDESELALIPLMLKVVCVERAAALYKDVSVLTAQYMYAERIYRKLQETISPRRIDIIFETAVTEFSEAGHTRLWTILSENDEFSYIEELKTKLSRLGKNVSDEAGNDRSYQLRLSELAANIAGTLRFSDSLRSDKILEDFSLLGQVLSEDRVYLEMDMPSKRAYANACDSIARSLSISQVAVAREAQKLAQGEHIGKYLIEDNGRCELIRSLGGKAHINNPRSKLFAFIVVQVAAAIVVALFCAIAGVVQGLLSLFPAFIIINTLFLRIACIVKKPVAVPRIAVKGKSPEKIITAVSVLVTDEKSLQNSIDRMETHYMAGNLDNTYYAIVGDFVDSDTEGMTQEEERLIEFAQKRTAALNKKYAQDGDIFFFLLRKRERNPSDDIYMGRERKRGAIADLFSLLSGRSSETEGRYALITSRLPEGIKYALLLDSDTVITKGTLAQLVGAAIHPLNKAEVKKSVITHGYGIFVPRMERLPGERTEFMRTHSGSGGITPYSSLVSDFYHDYFGEAVFGGKGLVDIAAFCECTNGRIDDNTVLSHDMLESCMTRSAYLSDVILYDSEPAKIFSWWKREHRWIRGDWQLLPYIVARAGSKKHLDALSVWKLTDNLRRSLSPCAIALVLWLIPFLGFGAFAYVGVIAAFADSLIDSGVKICEALAGRRVSLRPLGLSWGRSLLDFMALPYAAGMTYDAILRTLYRLIFSHRLMLQWQTAAQTERGKHGSILYFYGHMWQCLWLGLRLLLFPLFGLHGSLVLGLLYLYAPFALHLADAEYHEDKLTDEIKNYYATLAYDIWCFFENETSEAMGYIPPDNVQAYPYMPSVCNSSPTNIGMGIMATVSAYDLGFIDDDTLLHRLRVTVDRLQSLEKWNGHLYNWYDTETGEKLLPAYVSTVDSGNLCACLLCASQLLMEIDTEVSRVLAHDMSELVSATDFSTLFDEETNLFNIGYDVTRCTLTEAWYDLLASEARLTYLVACALNKIPQKAWLSLGRVLIKSGDSRALVSWSGTMFEYLMPVIFTGLERGTLMDETCKAAVDEHINCACGKPWGISESGYYAFDRSMYYQYRAFGAPNLGLAPMTAYEDVRAPYAAVLAAMVYPDKAYEDLRDFEEVGARGKYGFFEAVDYTQGRVQEGHDCEIVRSFMAHHMGMSICALNNILSDNVIVKRFSSIPEIRAIILYSAEKLPETALTLRRLQRMVIHDDEAKQKLTKPAQYNTAGRYPRGVFLTNGSMTALLSDSGISYVKLGDVYITRFRRDYVRGNYGIRLYLRYDGDVYCINTYDAEAAQCAQSFTYESYRAQTEVKSDDFTVKTESIVMQNDDVLCMKISVANHTLSDRSFELGAFIEMSLAKMCDDVAHPAFVRLTVDAYTQDNAIIFRRRGTKNRKDIYACAKIVGGTVTRFCADGLESPGRHGSYVQAMHSAMYTDLRIKTPVEPVMSLRNEFSVRAGEREELMLVLGAAHDVDKLNKSIQNACDADFSRQKSLSFAMEMSSLHFMGVSAGKAQLLTAILMRVACGISTKQRLEKRTTLKIQALFKFGISGDIPIVLAEINSPTQFRLLKTLLSLLRFAGSKLENFDLVIIGNYAMSYRCDIRSYITDTLSTFMMSCTNGEGTRIHFIDGYDLSGEERTLLMQSADIVVDNSRTPGKQFADEPQPRSTQRVIVQGVDAHKKLCSGEFVANGEYVITMKRNEMTPLPWSNIICNPQNEQMGTLVTESGGGYTWCGNCHDARLTPWYCDTLRDQQGEIIFISDDEGNVRSICHSRIQGTGEVQVRHGFGYSVFENDDALCLARMTVFTDTNAPQKLSLLELTNTSDVEKKLRLKYMIDKSDIKGAYSEFSEGIAYLSGTNLRADIYATVRNADSVQFSADREGEFMLYDKIHNTNYDGFISLACDIRIRAHEKRDLVLIMGMAQREKAARFAQGVTVGSAHEKLAAIKRAWEDKLCGIEVQTPDDDFNNMVNARLLYQVYASRLMGRTGFYQSGGAMGFRDQLQDVLALLYTDPERAKGQILLCASMQYQEGDVLHWWHAPADGVRTHISDDKLFLPFVCTEYASVTGDYGIFDISVPYLEDKEIPEGHDDIYYSAKHSNREATIYEHCMGAIRSACKFGTHGLPLMGTGDWNDGMDNVGKEGGESVFLAFLLIVTIEKFMRISARRNDAESFAFLRDTLQSLRSATEKCAWDGEWFRRAYYGDGTPLGSKENGECMIDLLSQAWGVFADRKRNPNRCTCAMKSTRELLIDEAAGIMKLLTPPFSDNSKEHYAGYIESYAEGVRENGGQYTHAAIWYLIAQCYMESDEEVMKTLSMLNPAKKSPERYMAEPYVVAADVYSCKGYEGRGGWSWYTGSAAWFYIAAIRYVVGLVKHGDMLTVEPHNTWKEYTVTYRFKTSIYEIHITQGDGVGHIVSDGKTVEQIQLTDDGKKHIVEVSRRAQNVDA